MKKLLMATLFLLLIAGLAQSSDVTDYERLAELKAEFDARWESWQGPDLEAAKLATTGFYGEINADPNAELMGIDEQGNPVIYYLHNVNAALTTRTDRIRPGGISGYDLDGSTITRLYHWDNSTVNPNHTEFSGRINNMDGGSSNENHANHTAGTMMASGVNSSAKGMATAATLHSYDWYNDDSEMVTAGANGAKVSSHSYGTGWGYGEYSTYARDYDQVTNAAPYYLICLSAGNSGSSYNTIASSNTAKNVIVVGSVNDVLNYSGPGSVSLAGNSSRGPCDDDRLKPDVVGNGVSLYSCSVNSYTTMSGTSMACPNIAGSAFLLYEQYHQTHGSYPWSSTIKGVIIHTADECGSWTGPDYKYGWGLMDAEDAADLIAYDADVDDVAISEHYLVNGLDYEQVLEVPGGGALRATICWNDPAANAGAAVALINDLDIRVTEVSSGTTTMPWVLNGNTVNPASHGDNTVDNVEQVYISNADAGAYTLTVTHKGTLQGSIPQAFSLIITGATDGELPEISLTLTPTSNYIMPGGGNLVYDVDFSYNGANSIPGSSYWVDLILPNGNDWGPLFRYNFTITPGQQISTTLTHYIPGYAPGGTYTVIGKVGTYPTSVLVSDEFAMVKFGTAPGGVNGSWLENDPAITGQGNGFELPEVYALSEAYPNPFNPTTTVAVNLPEASDLTVTVFNMMGQQVAELTSGKLTAGSHSFVFDAGHLVSGLYFVRAIVPGQLNVTRKVMLVR